MSEPQRPLVVFRFTLTAGDVLACLRREPAGSGKLFLFPLLLCAGGVAAAVPGSWPLFWRWGLAGVAAFAFAGLLFLMRDLMRRRRALRLARREGAVTVEDWGDHLAVHSNSGSRFLALETVAQVMVGGKHVFLRHHGGPTILPLRAFADAADMQAYAEVLDGRSLAAGA